MLLHMGKTELILFGLKRKLYKYNDFPLHLVMVKLLGVNNLLFT